MCAYINAAGKKCPHRHGLGSHKTHNTVAAQRRYNKRLRALVLKLLGGKCARCPWKDPRALQIDHKNGNTPEGRRRMQRANASHLRYVRDHLDEFQLLCANHNWVKRAERHEYGVGYSR
jgi:hypothetical protein